MCMSYLNLDQSTWAVGMTMLAVAALLACRAALTLSCTSCWARTRFSTASNLLSGPPELQHNMSVVFCMLHCYSNCLAVRLSRTAAHVCHVLHASAPHRTCRLALQNCSTTCLPCSACFTATEKLLSDPPLLHSMSTMFSMLHRCSEFANWSSTTAAQDVYHVLRASQL